MSDHDVPDPTAVALEKALAADKRHKQLYREAFTRGNTLEGKLERLESELARVRGSYEWVLKGVAELQAVIAATRAEVYDDCHAGCECSVSRAVQMILETASSDVLAAHDAQVKADAWHEGLLVGQDPYGFDATDNPYRSTAFKVRGTGTPTEEGDTEEFCSRCYAGVDSSEHHNKCVVTGHAEDGESA